MPVTPPVQNFRSTVQSGSLNNADTSTAASVITTKATYPALTTGIRQFVPNTTVTATATIPAVGSAPTNSGWRMAADISTEKVTTRAGSSFVVNIAAQQDSGTNLTAAMTVICFLDGVEIGRGTSSSAALNGTTQVNYGVTISIPNAVTSTSSNPRFSWEVYCNVTGLNTNAISSVNISLILNTATGCRTTSMPELSVAYVRTTSDSQASTDTASRTNATSRTASESTSQTDTASRVYTGSRATSDSHATSDSTARQITYARTTAEALSAMAESAARTQVDFRRTTENATIPTDTASRTVTTSRTSSESTSQADTASKTITYQRVTLYQFQPQDEPASAQTRHISGVVRNSDGTPYLGGAAVILIREDNVVVQVQTSSTVDGSYDFPRNLLDTHTYTVAAHTFITGAPHQAVTPRALSPV